MAHSMVQATIHELTVTGEQKLEGKPSGTYAPSHIVKFAGKPDAAADATGTIAITVTGAKAATDFAQAQLIASANAVTLKYVVVTDNTVTITLSGAGGAGTQVNYAVFRPVV